MTRGRFAKARSASACWPTTWPNSPGPATCSATVTWYNKRWLDYTGLSFEDMKGWGWDKVQHPDHVDRVVERVKRSAETGEPWEDTFPLRGKDGQYRWFLSRAMPVRDEQGKLVRWFGTNTDVTEQVLAEEKLRRREQELSDFFDNATVGLHWVGPDGIVLQVNQTELDMLGYCREEYVGRHIADFHIDRHVIDDILERLTRGEKLFEYPARLRCKDGSIRDVLINSSALFESGRFIHTRCFTHDITERKRAGEALRESEVRLAAELCDTQLLQRVSAEMIQEDNVEALYEKIMDAAVAIMRSDYASMQMLYPERGSGGELRLLASRGFTPEATKFWEWVRADLNCTCGVALKTGKRVIATDVATCDFMAGTEDQTTYLQAGILAVQSTPLLSRKGQIVGMISTHWRQPYKPAERDLRLLDILARQAADLIERKQAEIAMQHLGAIVDSSDDAIVSKNLDGIITSWNRGAQRLFGYTTDEVVGKPVTILIPPDRQDEEPNILRRIRSGEHVDHFETVRQRKDGTPIDISLSISPVRDAAGKIVGASKIARDITARKQAETTQQMLLNELNHRVKNTLASVQAIAQQTLARTQKPADFVASFGGRIQSLARVHTLLSATTWQGADLRDLIRDQVLSGPVDETRLTAWGPSVRLDPQLALHLALMLHELGTNACKYGALSIAGGWVTINWTTDDALHIQWMERGGPPVVTPSKRGFGFTLIEQSAKGQGGEAQMLCEAEGITWKITLPLHERADSIIAPQIVQTPSSEPSAAGGEPRTTLAGRRFLVVEDEPLIGLDIVAGLEDAQAQVEGPIGTAKEAIEMIERMSFDAALLDANLHGRPVDEIASALTRRGIPFAFVTGHGPEGLPPAFRGAALLGKPCSRQQVLETAEQLVAGRGDVVRLRR